MSRLLLSHSKRSSSSKGVKVSLSRLLLAGVHSVHKPPRKRSAGGSANKKSPPLNLPALRTSARAPSQGQVRYRARSPVLEHLLFFKSSPITQAQHPTPLSFQTLCSWLAGLWSASLSQATGEPLHRPARRRGCLLEPEFGQEAGGKRVRGGSAACLYEREYTSMNGEGREGTEKGKTFLRRDFPCCRRPLIRSLGFLPINRP